VRRLIGSLANGARRIEAQRIEACRIEACRIEACRIGARRIGARRIEAQRIELRRFELRGIEQQQNGVLRTGHQMRASLAVLRLRIKPWREGLSGLALERSLRSCRCWSRPSSVSLSSGLP